jgi:hypothetical protein
MGARLLQYYEYAKTKGGIAVQVKLAMKTAMPQNAAGGAPDSPDTVSRFYNALKEILNNDPGIPAP